MTNRSTSAQKQNAQRLWIAFIILLAVILSGGLPSTANAQEESYAYYWSLTFDFENGINGQLYVAVGYEEDGDVQEPPIYSQTYTVPCTRTGNAGISGGVLKLNGGYLSCDLDVQRALNDAILACGEIVSGCYIGVDNTEEYAHFQAMATVMSANPGDAPIFHHPDASYRINPQSSTTQITGSLSPHGVIPSTPAMAVPVGVWNDFSAFYTCGGVCGMEYSAAGGFEVVATANALVPFSTPATTIYIGYDPVANVTAPVGTFIDYLFVDPPNHGND